MARLDSSSTSHEWGFTFHTGGHSLFLQPLPQQDETPDNPRVAQIGRARPTPKKSPRTIRMSVRANNDSTR